MGRKVAVGIGREWVREGMEGGEGREWVEGCRAERGREGWGWLRRANI